LSVYRKPAAGQINQEEVHLYGSSRLGIVTRHMASDSSFSLVNSFGKIYSYKFTRGEKLFELSNHLGNVLVTLSDRVQQVKVSGDTVRHYLADERSANDYYPFGMLMPGRKFNAGSFRYGFNGKENDNDVKGEGNQINFGARIYDPRVARFFSVDPYSLSFPDFTPFSFAANSPLSHIDKDGEFAQWILQYGINVGINVMTQMLTAYMLDPNVSNWEQAWGKVTLWQAFGEGVVDMIGTKKIKMASNAVMGMATYIDQVGVKNITGEGLVGSGLIGLLEPIVGDAISKHGSKAVLAGLKKMGLNSKSLRQLGFNVNNFSLGTSFEKRHVASRISAKSSYIKDKNTVALKGVDFKGDLSEINDGLAAEVKDKTYGIIYELKNGNRYYNDGGTIKPLAGGGYVDLSRGAAKALGLMNDAGSSNSEQLRNAIGKQFSVEEYKQAVDVYNKSR